MLKLESSVVERLSAIRLVLMDIDGTLVTASRKSFDNVLQQLRKLKPLGINFSLATGRSIYGARPFAQKLQLVGMRLPPMIAYNGAVVVSAEDASIILRSIIPAELFRAVVMACRKHGYPLLAYSCNSRFDFSAHERVFAESRRANAREFNGMLIEMVRDLTEVEAEFVAVLVDLDNHTHATRAQAVLANEFGGRLRVTTSGANYVEICATAGNKLQAMLELAHLRKIHVSEILAIGDNYNDLEMIKGAGVGAAVANSPPAVRAAADIECTRAGAEGVVEILRTLARVVRSRSSLHRRANSA